MIDTVDLRDGDIITPVPELMYYARIALPPLERDAAACPRCGGAQYGRYVRPAGASMFGVAVACPYCAPQPEPESAPLPTGPSQGGAEAQHAIPGWAR